MHGPEEAVATSWFKERAKGVVTSLQSAEFFTTAIYDRLSPRALPTSVGLSFVRVLLRWFLVLSSAHLERPVTSTLAKTICQMCVYRQLRLPWSHFVSYKVWLWKGIWNVMVCTWICVQRRGGRSVSSVLSFCMCAQPHLWAHISTTYY